MTDHEVYKMPMEEKENFKWLESYRAACKMAEECPNTKIINIFDREADFAELFVEVNQQQKNKNFAEIIVRAVYDRSIKEDGCEETKKLKDCLKTKKSLGEISFTIPATKNKEKRIVNQKVSSATVTFSKRNTGTGLLCEFVKPYDHSVQFFSYLDHLMSFVVP